VGKHFTLSTTLTTNGHPVAGVPVVLFGRPDVAGTWTQIRSLTTDANGSVSTDADPNVNVQYSWSFAGDANDASASSPVFAVGVHQAVTANASTTFVVHKHSIEVYGIVAPSDIAGIVHLQKLLDGQWVAITRGTATVSKQLLPDGTTRFGYVMHWAPQLGHQNLVLRIHRRETAVNLGGSSAPFQLTVA
jgi:hypothetical protein